MSKVSKDSLEKLSEGIVLKINDGKLKLIVLSETIVHVIYILEEEFPESDSLIVEDKQWPKVEWELIEKDDFIILKTKKIRAKVDLTTGSLSFLDDSDEVIMQEPEQNARELEKTVVSKEETYHIKQSFHWDEGEALYGLGQHQDIDKNLNYRGIAVDLYQDNMKVSVPVLLSSKGYGILWHNYSLTKFRDTDEGSYLWSEVADAIDYYFIYGPELDLVIQGVRGLTGKPPMLPRWAFGYVQCKERYKTADELLGIVKEYREREIPLDVIVQDWRYWGSMLKWGQKSFNKKRYPDPKGTFDEIHDLGAHVMISIWPSVFIGKNRKEMAKAKFFFKGTNLRPKTYDAFNPEARKMYWKHLNEGLFQYGIDAWWADSTEPYTFMGLSRKRPNREVVTKKILASYKKHMTPSIGTGARYLNLYSLMQAKGIYEGQRGETSDKRVVNLTRSGFVGQQRYSTIVWSGDVSATWDVFATQIPAGLNFCSTGLPYWTTDIGAFMTKNLKIHWFMSGNYPKGSKDLGYREFYTRWFQFGAFCPMFRSHGTNTPKEVWRFGEPGTMFYDTLVNFLNLRYRLLPYIYSLAWMVTDRDYTMMRCLAFDFPQDENVLEINHQYMFGSALLVCPVLKPMYYDIGSKELEGVPKTRSVYLPAGTDWYDFWTGKKLKGGQTIEAEAPLEVMPLYVRAGSIVPLGPIMQYSTEKPVDPIELRVYSGSDGEFLLYEDENDNYNYETGAYSTIPIFWNQGTKELTIGKREGKFPGMLEQRIFNIVLINEKKGLGITPSDKIDAKIDYKGEEISLKI